MVKQKVLVVFVLLVLFSLAVAPAPAAAQTSGPVAPDGFNVFCLPKGTLYTSEQLATDVQPANARLMKMEDKTPVVTTVDDACFFVFTFTNAMPEGAQLQFFDNSKALWLKADLKPGSKEKTGFAAVRHIYVVDPPFWSVTYDLKLVDKAGAVLWSSPVIFRRGYEPGKCYDGKWPDPVTWYCYYPPDAHPWDPWYKFENPKP